MSSQGNLHDSCAILVDHVTRTYLLPLVDEESGRGKRRRSDGQASGSHSLPEGEDELGLRVPTMCRLLKEQRPLSNMDCANSPAHLKVRRRMYGAVNQLLQSRSSANRWVGLSVLLAVFPQMDYDSFQANYRFWVDAILTVLRTAVQNLIAENASKNNAAIDEDEGDDEDDDDDDEEEEETQRTSKSSKKKKQHKQTKGRQTIDDGESSETNSAENGLFLPRLQVAAIDAAGMLLCCGFQWPDTRRDLTIARSAKANSGRQIDLAALVSALVKCLRRLTDCSQSCLLSLLRCLETNPNALRAHIVKIHWACLPFLQHQSETLRSLAVSCLAAIPLGKKRVAAQDASLKDDEWYVSVASASVALRTLLNFAFGEDQTNRSGNRDYSALLITEESANFFLPKGCNVFEFPEQLGDSKRTGVRRSTASSSSSSSSSSTTNDDNDHDDDDDNDGTEERKQCQRLRWIRVACNRVEGLSSLLVQLFERQYGFSAHVPTAALLLLATRMLSTPLAGHQLLAASRKHQRQAPGTFSTNAANIFGIVDPSMFSHFASVVRRCGHRVFDALVQRCQRALLLPFHHMCTESLLRQLHDQDPSLSLLSSDLLASRLAVYQSMSTLVRVFGAAIWDTLGIEALSYLLRDLASVHTRYFSDRSDSSPLTSSFPMDFERASDADSQTLLAVLACLQALVSTCAPLCTTEQWATVEKAVVLQCVAAQKSMFSTAKIANIYDNGTVRLACLQTLLSLVVAPLATQPPCLPFALQIFRTALSDPYFPAQSFAAQAQATCICLLRPRSLPLAVANEPVAQLTTDAVRAQARTYEAEEGERQRATEAERLAKPRRKLVLKKKKKATSTTTTSTSTPTKTTKASLKQKREKRTVAAAAAVSSEEHLARPASRASRAESEESHLSSSSSSDNDAEEVPVDVDASENEEERLVDDDEPVYAKPARSYFEPAPSVQEPAASTASLSQYLGSQSSAGHSDDERDSDSDSDDEDDFADIQDISASDSE